MKRARPGTQALLWGALTALLYWGLFHYGELLVELAYTTVDTCLAPGPDGPEYFTHATPRLCEAKGGQFIDGNPLHVLVPVAVAFVFSYVHGIFTGLFWDAVGLRSARK